MKISLLMTYRRIRAYPAISVFLIAVFVSGCEIQDVITGVGAGILGGRAISGEAKDWKARAEKVTQKDVLANVNAAYAEFYSRTTDLWANTVLTQKEKIAQYKIEERTLNARIKGYKSLMLADNGFITADILQSLQEAPETKELVGMLTGLLPSPWNEIIPLILLAGLSTATGTFARRSSRLSGKATDLTSYATTMGNMIEGFKKTGRLSKDEIKSSALVAGGGIDMNKFNMWLKTNNIIS